MTAHTPPSGAVTTIIGDGLDASVDGRGFGIEHQRAFDLANSAPALRDALHFIRDFPANDNSEPDVMDAALAAIHDCATKTLKQIGSEDPNTFWVIQAEKDGDLFATDLVRDSDGDRNIPDEETCRGVLEAEWGSDLGDKDIVVYGPYTLAEMTRH